jgi:hypothetical protein
MLPKKLAGIKVRIRVKTKKRKGARKIARPLFNYKAVATIRQIATRL